MSSNAARPKIVLLIDNIPGLVEANVADLQQQGYTAIGVTAAHDALELIKDRWIHLVVIDLRLSDEADALDYSGVELAINPLFQMYPRIIYTAYPSFETYRRLQKHFGQLPESLIISSKQEQPLIEIVADAFGPTATDRRSQVGINFAQRLEYTDRPDTRALVSLLEDMPDDGNLFMDRVREVEDLFGKAFPDCEALTISLLAQGRRSGFVLIVTRQRDGEVLQPLIVKCGERALINREYRNYQDHVKDRVYRVANLIEDRPTQTLHFGLLKYRIADDDIENTLTFADFYRQQLSPIVEAAIQHLFREAKSPWHKPDMIRQRASSLSRFYEDRLLFHSRRSTADRPTRWAEVGVDLRRVLSTMPPQIRVTQQEQSLVWTIGTRTWRLPEPHRFLTALHERPSELFPPVYLECRGHGDLHAENIRVDDDARVWLIDFEHAGWGPLLQDAVELESSIRFGLLQDRQIERLLYFEEALASQRDLRIEPEAPQPILESNDLMKAFDVITTLRQEAGQLESAQLADYFLGLIYQALRMLKQERPHYIDLSRLNIYKVHALFVASVYCHQLALLQNPERIPPVPQPII